MPLNQHDLNSSAVYLNDDEFNRQAFVGQQSNLFDTGSFRLKQMLHSVLTKLFSSENLEFLTDLHSLNSNKSLTALQMQAEIAVIEKKYIAPNADFLLNISQQTLIDIRSKTSKNLNDYKEAIKEVYDLIQTNVNSSLIALVAADRRIVINKLAIDISQQLDVLISMTTTLPALLKKLSNSEQDKISKSCQQICKNTQKQLSDLSNNKVLTDTEVHKNFELILINIIGKLSENFQMMKAFEKSNPAIPRKSVEVEKMIEIINNLVSNNNEKRRENSVTKKNSQNRLSETPSFSKFSSNKTSISVSSDDKNSFLETSQSLPLRSDSPSLSKSNKRILPKLYEPSSRATESPANKNSDDDFKPKFRPK